MKKLFSLSLAVVLCFAGAPSNLLSQQTTVRILGIVEDTALDRVPNLQIIAKDKAGKVLATAPTDTQGEYVLENLPPLQEIRLTLDPGKTCYLGQTVKVEPTKEDLFVYWRVSCTEKAIALAIPRTLLLAANVAAYAALGAGTLLGILAGTQVIWDGGEKRRIATSSQ